MDVFFPLTVDLKNKDMVSINAFLKELVIHNSLGACECVHGSDSHSMGPQDEVTAVFIIMRKELQLRIRIP